MFRRFVVAAAILTLLLSACAPATGAIPLSTQAPADTAAPARPTAAPAQPGALELFTWAEDDFEQHSLEKLVESFQTTQNIPTNLVVVR